VGVDGECGGGGGGFAEVEGCGVVGAGGLAIDFVEGYFGAGMGLVCEIRTT
jgi:hypothetical protein